jgi:hypothetical protein|tara:strand:- start:449 stop:898 length:450 start_codon:yes stop_codon:yes gene_type:complete
LTGFDLKPGSVVRFDFLWKDDEDKGLAHGLKDRPCAVVLMSKKRRDGARVIMVCPITHEPPDANISAVEIPLQVARALKLDADRMWIKTHEVNTFEYREPQIPYGITPAHDGQWSFGQLPYSLGARMHQQVMENSRSRNLARIDRERPE